MQKSEGTSGKGEVLYVTGTGKLKLTAFAASRQKVPTCRVCSLPKDLVAQINDSPGVVGARTISLWLLKEHNLTISRDCIRKHLMVCKEA